MSDHLEVEWQFDVDDLGAVERWLAENRSAFGITASAVSSRELEDTYYDTEDWRFYRAGYVLRVRRTGEGAEATMKAISSPAEDGVRRRREINEPLEGRENLEALIKARGPVGERLRVLAASAELRPLFEISTSRRVFELRAGGEETGTPAADGLAPEGVVEGPEGDIRLKDDGTLADREVVVDALGGIHRTAAGPPVGEVALDETQVFASGKSGRLSRVEVEATGEGVETFVEGLREALELRPTRSSKFGMGLDVADLEPATVPDLGPTEVEASMSVGEVTFAVLRRHFATMIAHEPGVRLGEDPEDLHDMRVATRRLRATLKLYAQYLPKRAERFERDLKWIASHLGDVRDLDVHLEHLAREAVRWEEGTLGEVVAVLEERRQEARRRMTEALDSARYERLVSGFTGMVRRGRSPVPAPPVLDAAPDLVRERYRKVRKRSKGLNAETPAEEYHDLRKKGKRLRYAVEPLRGIYGKPAQKMVSTLKDLQDDLGGLQDLIVFSELMEELAASGDLAPQTVFCMGVMSERYASEASRRREDLPKSQAIRDVRKRWKALRSAMKRRTGEKAKG